MPAFKEGDVVQLKSGGPTMTIIALENSSGEATCSWLEGRKPTEDIFDVVALELSPKQQPTSQSFRLRPRNT
jgi:uncharacterized protein YodC (DUF2158 family)